MASVSGGSAATWVNGPLVRTLPANLVTGSTYTFPVGKGSFKMLELVNPTTGAGGTVTIEAEAFDADSGGTAGTGFDALNHNRYWSAQITAGAANFTNTTVRLTEQGTATANAIGQSATLAGAYDSIGGPVTGATIGPSNTITSLGYFAVGRLTGARRSAASFNVGTGGDYATLTAAVAALNSRVMTGPVTFLLTDNTYAGETFPIQINPNGGNSATNTLTIKPAGGRLAGDQRNLDYRADRPQRDRLRDDRRLELGRGSPRHDASRTTDGHGERRHLGPDARHR